MFRNRVIEFEGPEYLSQAGEQVLQNPGLDMAVVHDVPFPYAHLFKLPEDDRAEILKNVPEIIPQLAELDAVVIEWWGSHKTHHILS